MAGPALPTACSSKSVAPDMAILSGDVASIGGEQGGKRFDRRWRNRFCRLPNPSLQRFEGCSSRCNQCVGFGKYVGKHWLANRSFHVRDRLVKITRSAFGGRFMQSGLGKIACAAIIAISVQATEDRTLATQFGALLQANAEHGESERQQADNTRYLRWDHRDDRGSKRRHRETRFRPRRFADYPSPACSSTHGRGQPIWPDRVRCPHREALPTRSLRLPDRLRRRMMR